MNAPHAIRYDSGPNMTPLVDVVMVILIFLILAGTFHSGQFLKGPTIGGGGVSTNPLSAAPIDLFVDAGPDGFVARFGGERIDGDANALFNRLAEKRKSFGAAGIDDVQVLVRPGRTVRYDHVIRVYEAAVRAGFTKVGFAPSR